MNKRQKLGFPDVWGAPTQQGAATCIPIGSGAATPHGTDYPSVTFPRLKKYEIAKHSEYRTQRLVLEAWGKLHV